MRLVVNGQDGNGLQLENAGRRLQVFAHVSQIKSAKMIITTSSFKLHSIFFP